MDLWHEKRSATCSLGTLKEVEDVLLLPGKLPKLSTEGLCFRFKTDYCNLKHMLKAREACSKLPDMLTFRGLKCRSKGIFPERRKAICL